MLEAVGCAGDAGSGRGRLIGWPACLAGDGGDLGLGHPARVDQAEVVEIRRHVERDAVVADAAFDAQAERADLARRLIVRVAPDTGEPVASAGS